MVLPWGVGGSLSGCRSELRVMDQIKKVHNNMKHSKETLDVVHAALALASRDVELGLVDVEDLQSIPRTRFAAVERKKAVALLKKEGKSDLAVARELKIDASTVARDMGRPHGSDKTDAEKKRIERAAARSGVATGVTAALEDDHDLDLGEAKSEAIKQNFLIRADRAAEAAAYHGQIDEEVRRAVTRTAIAWNKLARTIGE